eukprot:gene2311-2350_t
MLFTATRYGLGLSPDSTAYVKAADGLLKGYGWAFASVQWPPLYSLVLAIFGFPFGGNVFFGARPLVSYVLAFLISLHEVLLWVDFYVWSEPLLIIFVLLDLLLIRVLLVKQSSKIDVIELGLIGLAIMAVMTRYIGINVALINMVVVPAILMMLWLSGHQAIDDNSAIVRTLQYPEINTAKFVIGLENFGRWLYPSSSKFPGLIPDGLLMATGLALLLAILLSVAPFVFVTNIYPDFANCFGIYSKPELEMAKELIDILEQILFGTGFVNSAYESEVQAMKGDAQIVLIEKRDDPLVATLDSSLDFERVYEGVDGLVWVNRTIDQSVCIKNEADIPESYRADIDGLRAIAVLAVVGFHAFPGRIQGGFVALSLILLSCLVAGWFLELPKEYAQLGKHVSTGAAFVSNLTLWQEAGYFDPVSHSKPLLHLWSLGIEEQFYIFYPLVLYLIGHLSKARGRPLLLLTLASFVLSVFQIGADTSAAFYSPLTRFWELSVGGLLVLAQSHHDLAKCSLSRLVKNSMSIIGLAAIVLSLVLLSPNSVFPGWWAILPVGGTAALLWAGSDAIINKHLLSHRALVLVGLLSYPLYLWHWPLLTFAQIDASEPLSRSIRVAIVLISMVAAWVTYKYVEQPIRRRQLSVGLTTTLLTAIASIGLAGLIIYLLQGIPSRMPPIIQQLSAIEFDHSIQTRVGTCFLVDGQTAQDFSKCNDNPVEGRQFALLIGDSHASHLYPGLRKRFGEKRRLLSSGRFPSGTTVCLNKSIDTIESLNSLRYRGKCHWD